INDQMTLDISTIDNTPSGKKVSGKVYGKDGKPLPGVNIEIRGTTKGTVSDRDGSFMIQLDDPGQELHFSYIGYETVKKSFD
ncbi:MAG: carboxypeptidase-like regulatory domain-containing protein, partial [Cyclobacteriaceae bacterium]